MEVGTWMPGRAWGVGATRPRLALLDARVHGPVADRADLRARARSLAGPGPGDRICRSYRDPLALVAWHAGRVGVDLERVEPALPDGFAESICTPAERSALGGRLADPALVASLWSGKEALAKALGDAVGYDPRRLESPLLWADGRSGAWRADQVEVPSGHVAWLCWR